MSSVLDVKNLEVKLKKNGGEQVLAKDISFSVRRGECLGIVGESGSGKSLLCKAIIGLLGRAFAVDGEVMFDGKNLLRLDGETLRRLRGNEICVILQNPMNCFDPLYRIGSQMGEGLAEHMGMREGDIRIQCQEILEMMRIKNFQDVLSKYPHQLSGGMLQRIMIGLALAMRPKLIIADEPTTAIDSITQFEIIKELQRVRNTYGVAMIFVSHDLGVVSKLADETVVMHGGIIRRRGTMEDILSNPAESYTRFLIENKLRVTERFNKILRQAQGAAL